MLFKIILMGLALLILLLHHIVLKRIRTEQTDEFVHMNLGNQTLERLVAEWNHLIEAKQDIRSMAVRSERELTNMITSRSHDLRTPLTAIIGYIQLLEKEDLPSKDRQAYVSIVHARATQLYNLIQSFLVYQL